MDRTVKIIQSFGLLLWRPWAPRVFFKLSAWLCIINGMSKMACLCALIFLTYFWQLAWPHFCRTQLHSPPNGDFFSQKFEPASYFCDWTCVHLGMRRQKSPKFYFQSQFSMSKISFIILVFVSVEIIILGVQLMIYQFLITSFFEVVYFLKLGPIFVASYPSERKSNHKNN